MRKKSKKILAGDIGGTKTDLALFSGDRRSSVFEAEATFASGDYPSLEAIVRQYLDGITGDVDIVAACFGVAGPVLRGEAKITNLPWIIKEETLAKTFSFAEVRLINDLMACAYAVPLLEKGDLYELNRGVDSPQGAIALVAPGTGLGEAFLISDKKRYLACPSEGGHTDFAPADDLEAGLLGYLRRRYGHVSYENVCSGMGILNIYNYLKECGYAPEPEWLTQLLAAADDPVPIIVQSALAQDRDCLIGRDTLKTFVSILGAEAGNVALKIMALGGVYLGGGILPKIVSAVAAGPFMDSFCRKGRMSGLLRRIPVFVIMNPKAALCGAAYYQRDRILNRVG